MVVNAHEININGCAKWLEVHTYILYTLCLEYWLHILHMRKESKHVTYIYSNFHKNKIDYKVKPFLISYNQVRFLVNRIMLFKAQ